MWSVISDGVSGMLVSTLGSMASSNLAKPFQPFSSGRSSGNSRSSGLTVPDADVVAEAGCAMTPVVARRTACAQSRAAAKAGRIAGAGDESTGTDPRVVLLYLTTTILAALSPGRPSRTERVPGATRGFAIHHSTTADAAYSQFPYARQGSAAHRRTGARPHVCLRHDGLRLLPSWARAHAGELRYRAALAACHGISRHLCAQHHRYRRQNHSSCRGNGQALGGGHLLLYRRHACR